MERIAEAIERPVYDMLATAGGRRAFHMPGHKGRAPFGSLDLYALDTTELPNTDDLYAPEGGLLRAQRLYAEAAGAAETLFLHGGATAGIHAMLQLWAREGEVALLPRNAHLSAVNACILGGLRVRWIPVTWRADGYGYVREADVLAALVAYPEARVLLLTRPDYYGGCMPLEAIIQRAHWASGWRWTRLTARTCRGWRVCRPPGNAGRTPGCSPSTRRCRDSRPARYCTCAARRIGGGP